MPELLNKFKKLIGVLIVLLILTYAVGYLNTFSGMKEPIQKSFKDATGYGLAINGDVKIDLLPLPQVSLNQTSVIDKEGYSYDIGKIILRTSLFSLFSGELSPSKVTLKDASFEYNDIKDIISKTVGGAKSATNIPALELSNIDIIFSEEDSVTSDITGLNGKLTYSGLVGQNLYFSGGFSINHTPYKIDSNFKGFDESGSSEEIDLKLSNAYFFTSFNGRLKSFFEKPEISGKASLVFGNNNANDKASAMNLRSLAFQDDLKISADVEMSGKDIKASSINITSNSVSGGKGEIKYIYGDSGEFIGDVSIENINLDQFMHFEADSGNSAPSTMKIIENLIRPIIDNFNLSLTKSSAGGIRFNVKQVTFNKEEVKNLNIDANISEGQVLLNDFSVLMPGDATFKMLGSVTHNEIRPKFLGNMELNVNKFDDFRKWLNLDVSEELLKSATNMLVKSEVSLIPRNIKFEKIQATLGDSKMIGRVSVKNTGDKRLNTKLSLRFNKINMDDFKVYEGIENYITALFFYDAEKSGKLLSEYTKDYRWLRVYPIDLNGEVLIDNLVYKGQLIQNVQSAFRIEPSNMKFDRIIVMDPKLNMDTTLSFALTAFKPKVDVKTNIKKVDMNFIYSVFPSMQVLRAKLADAIEKSKEIKESLTAASKEAVSGSENLREKKTDEQLTIEKSKASKPVLDRYNSFSMHSFNGSFDIYAEGITGVSLPISTLKATGICSEGVLKFDTLSSNIFGGKLDATGSIVVATAVPAISFSYALNNFNPELLLNHYFGLSKISGYMSMSGTIAGNGLNEQDLLNRVRGEISVVGKKIRWSGFDLASIIKTVEYRMPYNQKLDNFKISIANGETEFDDLNGKISFADGVAKLENVDLTNNRASARYSANLNYYTGLISSIAKLTFIPSAYSTPLTIQVASKGKMSQQVAETNIDELNNFIQTQTGDYDRFIAEEQKQKEDSLIRNRRL